MSGGLVVPWQGALGPSVTVRIGNQSSPYLRYEFEIELKRFEADISGFNDLLTNALTTRGLIEFPAPAEGRFTRYGGIGFGVSFIDLGRGFDSRILPGGILSLSAIGLNLVALAGVEFDVDPGRGLDLFVEGRIDHTLASDTRLRAPRSTSDRPRRLRSLDCRESKAFIIDTSGTMQRDHCDSTLEHDELGRAGEYCEQTGSSPQPTHRRWIDQAPARTPTRLHPTAATDVAEIVAGFLERGAGELGSGQRTQSSTPSACRAATYPKVVVGPRVDPAPG